MISQITKLPDWLLTLLMVVWTFLLPMYTHFLFLLTLVIIDAISGIWLSCKRGLKFRFVYLGTTISKFFAYFFIALSGYILDSVFINQSLGIDFFYVVFMTFIAIGEFKSITMNFSNILGVDIWSTVVQTFGKIGIDIKKKQKPWEENENNPT